VIRRAGVRRTGRVVGYDDHAGFGEVEADGERFWFHCTQLLDGSRHAEPGQAVAFRVVPGHRGRWEAAEVG
jgi:cold shock CspA family protein